MMDHAWLDFYCNGVLNIYDLDSDLHLTQENVTLWGVGGNSEKAV